MEYKDVEDLISSPVINSIKEKMKQTKSFYESKDGIKNNTMITASKSLCKFYKQQKTSTFAIKGGENSYDKKEYKINKKNIGTTAYYRKNIQPFEDIQSFFEVLKLDYFEKGLKKVMKPEGKQVVDFLIGLSNKYSLPQAGRGKKNKLAIQFNPCKEERTAFELNETAYITIDEEGVYVDNSKNGDTWNSITIVDSDSDDEKLTLRGIETSETSTITQLLFLIKHEKEIDELVNNYKIKLEKEFKNWEEFKEEFNGRLAKYVLLDNLCGRK